jgi:hypothetical protein
MSRDNKPISGQPAPDEDGGFLTRWSRRKRDIAAQETTERMTAGQAAAEQAGAAPEVAPPSAPDMAGEPARSEAELAEQRRKELDELIASLPKVEEIDASTDVTGFLDARIPDALRNAALRATWISDPTIRDFLNDAREYALDYNTPGMAPGYGQLSESERQHAVEFVKTLFSSGPEPATDATLVEDQTQPTGEISDQESRALPQPTIAASHNAGPSDIADLPAAEAAGDDESLQPADSGLRQGDSALLQSSMDLPPEGAEAPHLAASLSDHVPMRRRGGGALPI